MFQPNPTGPMPSQESLQGDAMQNATRSLYAPAPQDQAGSSPDRQAYSKPLERPEPPERIPYQKYNPFSLGHANAYAKQAVDAENAHNDHIYQLRLTAYEAEQRRLMEGGFYRNQPRLSPPYQKMVDGVPHNFAVNTISGEEHDLGEAPPSSKNVSPLDSAQARADALEEAARIRAAATESAARTRADRPDRPFPDVLVQDIDPTTGKITGSHWENPVTHARTEVSGISMRQPPRPATPGSEKADIRREQLVKEFVAGGMGEDDARAKAEMYDRLNNPAISKGKAAASQPHGQPHPPLGGGATPAPAPTRLKPNFVYKSKTHPGQTFTTDAQGNPPPGE